MPLVIGVMSGTSLDGIDCVLVDFDESTAPALIADYYYPYSADMRATLARAVSAPDLNIDWLGALDVELATLISRCVQALLLKASVDAKNVLAVGSHGHTLRHRPLLDFPFSWQIGDGNVIAELTGITTVSDFRRRDVAAGGQGAPLVPAFHAEVFGGQAFDRAVLNIGGIANVTLLPGKSSLLPVRGFDTGPGNALLNDWIERQLGKKYDENGEWARAGVCCDELLAVLLQDDYFSKPIPKSCGREQFNLNWLEERLFHFRELHAIDIQATLAELTARSVVDAIRSEAPTTREIYVCGGGAHNQYLMERLRLLSGLPVEKTDAVGVAADWVEAMAFAWLAWRTLNGKPGNLPSVTGANRALVLGSIHPA